MLNKKRKCSIDVKCIFFSIKRLRDTVYKLRCMFVCTDVYFSRSCEQQFPLGGRLIAFGGKKTSLFYDLFLLSRPLFFIYTGRRAWQWKP